MRPKHNSPFIYTCDRCGGTDLQLSAWIDAKTGKVLDDDGPLEQAYCLNCENHVDWSTTMVKAPKVGDKIKTLDGDQDSDENNRERSVPPGTIGEVVDVDERVGSTHYHVVYPNGVWVILEDTDLPRYEVQPEDEENDTPHDKILLTFPIDPEDPEDNRAPDGWIEIQRDDSPDAPEGETWHPLASDDEAALAVCPDTACLYHCETGAMALLSDDEACKALPEGPVICVVPRAIARARYAEVGITIA